MILERGNRFQSGESYNIFKESLISIIEYTLLHRGCFDVAPKAERAQSARKG